MLTDSGGVVGYNNIIVEKGPSDSIYEGQDWKILWETERGVPQYMTFKRKEPGSRHIDELGLGGGGNKKKRRTKGKKIKRKKTKKQTRK